MMGKSLFDFDDIQAAENRRKEVAVRAGASPRAERYADSPLKKLKEEYLMKETHSPIEDKVREYVESNPLPGYNFVSTSPSWEHSEEDSKKALEEAKKAAEEQQKMMEEANENEYKVTDTSTGLPKAEPVLTEEEQEALNAQKKRAKAQREKERAHVSNLPPKPPASEDARPGATTSPIKK